MTIKNLVLPKQANSSTNWTSTDSHWIPNMTSIEFTFWLRGFLEAKRVLDTTDVQTILNKLDTVSDYTITTNPERWWGPNTGKPTPPLYEVWSGNPPCCNGQLELNFEY